MGMNAASTAIGSVMIGTNAERRWNRKAMLTKLTMMASSIRSRFRVLIDSSIKPRAVVAGHDFHSRRK